MDQQTVFNRLRQFDAYPKTLEDFRVKTYSGAAGKFTCLSTRRRCLAAANDNAPSSVLLSVPYYYCGYGTERLKRGVMLCAQ